MSSAKQVPATISTEARIQQLEAELAELRPLLIEAEATLADKLAAITAFEFQIRARLSPLLQKLEKLDAEIKALRQQLQSLGDNWHETADFGWEMGSSATADGDYRYRAASAAEPAKVLNQDETADLKKLYRELARRFHPDMAGDDADRAYRTQIMMAINAAYAAGDLEKLKTLALEPDAGADALTGLRQDKQVEILERELERVQRRLKEIDAELRRLARHRTSKMMQEAEEIRGNGRDFFAEKAADLHDQITFRQMDRDSLQYQLDNLDEDDLLGDGDFADAIWDATLEDPFSDDTAPEFDRYIRRRQDRIYFEEDFDDDFDME